MSETWAPASSTSETWTSESAGHGAFSQLGFSRVVAGGLRAFSMKSSDGKREVWDNSSSTSETWTAA